MANLFSFSSHFQSLMWAGIFILILVGGVGLFRFVLKVAWRLINLALSVVLIGGVIYIILHYIK